MLAIAFLSFFAIGTWGLILTVQIAYRAAGILGALSLVLVLPFLYWPLHSGFAWGDWTATIVVFGGSLAGWALFAVASKAGKQP